MLKLNGTITKVEGHDIYCITDDKDYCVYDPEHTLASRIDGAHVELIVKHTAAIHVGKTTLNIYII